MSAPIQVGVKVQLDAAEAQLRQLEVAGGDLRPVFRRIDQDVTRQLHAQFNTGGAALGTPWKSLSPTTIRLRTRLLQARGGRGRRTVSRAGRARGGWATPLRDTNRLWASYTKPQGRDALRVIGPREYVRGTLVPYAAFHQEGFTVKQMFGKPLKHPVDVPARPVIPESMPAPVISAWEGLLVQHLTRAG